MFRFQTTWQQYGLKHKNKEHTALKAIISDSLTYSSKAQDWLYGFKKGKNKPMLPIKPNASLSAVVLVSCKWQLFLYKYNFNYSCFSIQLLLKMYWLFKRKAINKDCAVVRTTLMNNPYYLLSRLIWWSGWTNIFFVFQVLGTTTLQSSSVSTPTSSCEGKTMHIIY